MFTKQEHHCQHGTPAKEQAFLHSPAQKTAADVMGISFHTVTFHLRNIYEKLQVHSKSEAVAKALREHLI